MIRSSQRLLSIVLLLPIFTILVHNCIPHHHHSSTIEICCDNEQGLNGNRYLLKTYGHSQASGHAACCFNPEFTFDLFKILITSTVTDIFQIECPIKWIKPEYQVSIAGDSICRIYYSPNFLRGPPKTA